MHIGLYDTEHFETLYVLIKIWDEEEHTINLFVNQKVAQQLKAIEDFNSVRYNWYISDSNLDLVRNILLHHTKQGLDFIFFNTISKHHLLFAATILLLHKTKTILSIHDCHDFFLPRITLHPKELARTLGKYFLNKVVTAFSVLLQSTKHYIISQYQLDKKVYVIPGGLYNRNLLPRLLTNPLRLVVPGSIDTDRRSYNQVFELADYLEKNAVAVIIILLGTAVNEKSYAFISKAKSFTGQFVSFVFYENEFVDQREYDQQLSQANFILLPICRHYTKGSAKAEIYGLTKCSGSFFDSIRHGKPILIPSSVFISNELMRQCHLYQSIDELCIFISNLATNPNLYEIHSKNALINSHSFSLNNVKRSFFKQLQTSETPSGSHNTDTKNKEPG